MSDKISERIYSILCVLEGCKGDERRTVEGVASSQYVSGLAMFDFVGLLSLIIKMCSRIWSFRLRPVCPINDSTTIAAYIGEVMNL